MRLPINLFGRKDVITNDDFNHEINNKMSSQDNRKSNMDGINNDSNDDCTCMDNYNNHNHDNNNKDTTNNNKFGILNRFLPTIAPFRNQNATKLSRPHVIDKCKNASNATATTTNNVGVLAKSTKSNLNTNNTNLNALEPTLDINSNITLKHRDSLDDSSDNDNDVDKRRRWRKPYTRSDSIPSVEDSGFSSSNCLSDDRDDIISINASFDCECVDSNCKHELNKRDSVNSIQHPFLLSTVTARRRARTYSMDSTSSDLSDTPTNSSAGLTSKLSSSSLPTSCVHSDNSDSSDSKEKIRKSLSTSDHAKLSTVVVKRRSVRNKTRRTSSNAKSSHNHITSTEANPHAIFILPQPLNARENDSQSDACNNNGTDNTSDHNNNCADVTCKNLSLPLDAVLPFRFADLFRPHGLITLVACILYTLFLIFVCGGIALCWSILKKCMNKSDLKDLRENMLESRRRREIVSAVSSTEMDKGS